MYRQGDIVLIPIPFTDLSANKKRPVLILSSDNYNNNTDDFIVAAITSNIDNKSPSVTIMHDDLISGNLLRASCIRADKLYTLSQSIVIRKFGTVKNKILLKTMQCVYKVISLPNNFTVQIFAEDLTAVFEHYKKAFDAVLLSSVKGSQGELIHLEIDILGNKLAVAPYAAHEITKGNVTVICLKFDDKEKLIYAYNVLCGGGFSDGLKELPWSPPEGYVTDKFGVVWCIGL